MVRITGSVVLVLNCSGGNVIDTSRSSCKDCKRVLSNKLYNVLGLVLKVFIIAYRSLCIN